MRLRTYEAVLGSLLLLFTLASIARADDTKTEPQPTADGDTLVSRVPVIEPQSFTLAANGALAIQDSYWSKGALYISGASHHPACTIDSHGKATIEDQRECLTVFIDSICSGWRYVDNCEFGVRALLDKLYGKPKPEPKPEPIQD